MVTAKRRVLGTGRRMRHICIRSSLLVLVTAISQALSSGQTHSGPDDSRVIASVGPIPITVREFVDGFECAPAFVKSLKDPKGSYLNFLIDEKLLALEGYANKHDTIGTIRRLVTEIEDDLAVTQWYKEEVMPRISLDSAVVARALGQDNTKIWFRFVFSRDRATMEALSEQLRSGVTFDSIYSTAVDREEIIADEASATVFTATYHNPKIAAALAPLRVGMTSDVVQADDGYYLIHMDRVSMNAVITESEYQTRKVRMEARLRQSEADSVAAGLIKRLMERCPPTLKANALKVLQHELVRAFETSPEQRGISELHMLDRFEPISPQAESAGLRTILVDSDCDRFTVGTFVEWYGLRRYPLDLHAPTKIFAENAKGLVWRMVRDKRLIALARKKGYQNDPEVIWERRLWADKLVYWQERRRIRPPARRSDEQLGAFVREDSQRSGLIESTGAPAAENRPNPADGTMWSIEDHNAVFRSLQALRQNAVITIDENVLAQTHVSSGPVSKPIDVFLTRPGATLPRQAFPTIDRDWQFY